MKRSLFVVITWLMAAASVQSATVKVQGQTVTVRPDGGEARIVRLQVVADKIIRVQATSEEQLPQKQPSLMVVPQTAATPFTTDESRENVVVKTAGVQAVVNKQTGALLFNDGSGRRLLAEAPGGKHFWPFTVPHRELGIKGGEQPTQAMKHGLQWQMCFDSPDDEAFYGLGQHQSEELNMKGKNEDLFQYNTKVSIPFVLSTKGYGLLWDSYSFCRFGKPDDYLQLNRAFRLYDRQGHPGSLTGTYTDRNGQTVVRAEDSIYYEYNTPEKSEIARRTDKGGIRNLPQGFRLDGANVVYEGFIEPLTFHHSPLTSHHSPLTSQTHQFILYYAGYVRIFIGGEEVVAQRWRTAWNPNAYKFDVPLKAGQRTQLRIEWQPDGGESYIGLRVAPPRSEKERGQLSIWSEMARDMDYYFIAGSTFDEVIAGYRTLTGKASLYPKWALGFWQSRERYKTSQELLQTLAEFRRRHIPIDNIVQDWNYWPEDQWGSHRFEASRYPDPQAMVDSVHQMHGRLMISGWPKFYVNTDNYKQFDTHGWMYNQSPTDDIHDWVGPGYKNGFYDAYDPDARKLFWHQMDQALYTGLKAQKVKSHNPQHSLIDAWWMDASEPNVRDCTPMWYRKALCGPTAIGTSTEYFNAYALVNAQAIYEGQRTTNARLRAKGEPRVFLLTRSGFAGQQRYSTATWSGDIGTRWEDMRAQMSAGLNFSLSGVPFWGMDQGGFCVERRYQNAQRTFDKTGVETEDLREWRELQTRWNQFGTFIPIFRSHGQWPLREIWNIAPDDHPAYRSFVYYDRLRYHLMPYLYSLAAWAHFSDYTLMRALVMDFTADRQVHNIADQWMLGPALMACPVSSYKARSRSVYFPRQCGWYNLYTGEKVIEGEKEIAKGQSVNRQLMIAAPYEQIPVFVREGSIIPFGPQMEWSDEKPAELINLYVYSGADGAFQLYEDEGTNYNYERGLYATIDISYDDATRTVTFARRQGSFPGMLKQRRFNIVLVTPDAPRPLNLDNPEGHMVSYTGKELRLTVS